MSSHYPTAREAQAAGGPAALLAALEVAALHCVGPKMPCWCDPAVGHVCENCVFAGALGKVQEAGGVSALLAAARAEGEAKWRGTCPGCGMAYAGCVSTQRTRAPAPWSCCPACEHTVPDSRARDAGAGAGIVASSVMDRLYAIPSAPPGLVAVLRSVAAMVVCDVCETPATLRMRSGECAPGRRVEWFCGLCGAIGGPGGQAFADAELERAFAAALAEARASGRREGLGEAAVIADQGAADEQRRIDEGREGEVVARSLAEEIAERVRARAAAPGGARGGE